MCITLVRTLQEECRRAGVSVGSVGVITPYNEQVIESESE